MADPLRINDIVAVTIVGSFEQQTYENVLHYRADNPPDNTESYEQGLNALIASIKNDIGSAVITEYLPVIGANAGLDYIQAQRVYPTRDFYVRVNEAQPGTHAGDCLTGNISGVITKQSEKAGRGRSGSFHTFAVPEGTYEKGTFLAAYLTLLDELGDAIELNQRTFAGLDVWWPGMYSPTAGAGDNWSGIVNTTAQDTVRVMRRRTVRVGI